MQQLELFDVGDRSRLMVRVNNRQTCTPAPVGSGPHGETCGSCCFLHRRKLGKVYLKCYRTIGVWTGGAATDVKAKWPACNQWRPKKWPDNIVVDDVIDDWLLPPNMEREHFLTPDGCVQAADWYEERGDSQRAEWCRKLSRMKFIDDCRDDPSESVNVLIPL